MPWWWFFFWFHFIYAMPSVVPRVFPVAILFRIQWIWYWAIPMMQFSWKNNFILFCVISFCFYCCYCLYAYIRVIQKRYFSNLKNFDIFSEKASWSWIRFCRFIDWFYQAFSVLILMLGKRYYVLSHFVFQPSKKVTQIFFQY